MSRDRNPFRYLGVQFLDVAKTQGALFVVVAFGLAFVSRRFLSGAASALNVADLLTALVGGTLVIAILMAAGGVAGTDIRQGYYRALFSKPLAPWWFYLQRWLVGAVVVLTIPLWLALAFQLVFGVGGGLSWGLFGGIALAYLLVGGAVLLVSTVTSRDWLVVFLIYFLQVRLHDVAIWLSGSGQDVPAAVATLLTVLPPFHKIAIQGPPLSGADLAHVLGYGGGMVVAALAIFVWRPLGQGGRA
jgi:hypothetical protein